MFPALPELVLQFGLNVVVAVWCWRSGMRNLPLLLLLGLGFTTVPAVIAVSGLASALYLMDAAFFVSGLVLLSHKQQTVAAVRQPISILLIASLFVIPLVNTFVLTLSGAYRLSLMDAAHFVRTANLVLAFLAGYVLAGRENLGRNYVALSNRFAIVLAMIGVLHYFTPLSVPVYERILHGGRLPDGYTDVGLGFMGLFRGATGQLMTSVGVLALAGPDRSWLALVLPVLAGANVLMSGSRAGLFGLVLAVAFYLGALLLRARSEAVKRTTRILALALLALVVVTTLQPQVLDGPMERVRNGLQVFAGSADGSVTQRISGWKSSFHLLDEHPYSLLTGYSLANTTMLADKVGLHGMHNELLDVLVRYGLPALGVYVAMIVLMGLKFGRSTAVQGVVGGLAWAGFSLLVANVAMGITQNHLVYSHSMYPSLYFVYLTYGVLLGGLSKVEARSEHSQAARDETHTQQERGPARG